MSLRRLGLNPDGTRHTEDDGPAYARRAGFGGAAIGQAQTTFTVTRAPRGSVDEAAAAGHRSAAQQRAVERKRLARAAAKGA